MIKNPYWGKDFFSFFSLFFQRLFTGEVFTGDLASDEVQMFVLMLIAAATSIVGTFLVLKKMTMLANSLSHTLLLGLVAAFIIIQPLSWEEGLNFSTLLIASLVAGLATTFLTDGLTRYLRVQEDASIGLVFTTLFALSIVLVTVFTKNVHLGIEAVMGNVDALHKEDLKLIFGIALGDLLVVSLFFKELKIVAFDPGLASSQGISPNFFNALLMILTAATSIGAFRAVGVLLVLAFLVGLPLTARLLTHRLHLLIPLAAGIGVLCSLVAVALSRHFLSVYQVPLSTAGLVTMTIALAYVISLSLSRCSGKGKTV